MKESRLDKERRGKRIFRYIALILHDLTLNRWLIVELYINGCYIDFLMCAPAISVTGTIKYKSTGRPGSHFAYRVS